MSTHAPDLSNEAIGKRLVAIRQARGYLQGTVYKALNTSQQRWSNYEKGLRVLPTDLLYGFCKLTGAKAEYILFGSLEGMPIDLVNTLGANDEIKKQA